MKKQILFSVSVSAIIGALLVSCASSPPEKTAKPKAATLTKSEAVSFVEGMGIGYNLGNTLEACGDWIDRSSISNYERAWGAPMTTKAMFDSFKAAGFKTVRIPVAWSNLIGSDNTINPDLMNRVEQVVNWALEDDLYVVLNIHWDNGWFSKFSTDYDGSMKKYLTLWKQISNRFKDKPDRLVFESLNEEGGWNDLWNRWGGENPEGKKKSYGILNNMNQEFTNLVRASGGNNATRYLLIAGYSTDIDLTCDPLFKMPNDPVKHSIVSVHYYTPSTFTILDKDADWGKMESSWGTTEELIQVKRDMEKMRATFIANGIPVILGEYGTVTKNKDPESVHKYLYTVSLYAWKAGICPLLWDGPGGFFDRNAGSFRDPNIGEIYLKLSAQAQ